jgi:NAD(P)-dependent dehydrogenase (short-subunit alcohol dehydrogenase family)
VTHRLAGRSALVTGALGGIGACLVERLVAEGAVVLATDVAPEGAVPPGARYHPLDVRDEAAWHVALDVAERHHGTPDVLVNMAGVAHRARYLELPLEELRRQLDVNFLGAALGMRVVGDAMVARGRGHVVNITSIAGAVPVPTIAMYAATKAALRSLSLAVAAEWEETGVSVAVFGPDLTETPMVTEGFASSEVVHHFSEGGWFLSPEEVAGAILEDAILGRPAERLYPWARGALGRFLNAFPWIYRVVVPGLMRKAEALRIHGGCSRAWISSMVNHPIPPTSSAQGRSHPPIFSARYTTVTKARRSPLA